MPRQAKYGVQFIGYSAFVVARRNRHEEAFYYATLDFVTGGVILNAGRGFVHASHRVDLGPFLKSLPDRASELEQLLRHGGVRSPMQIPGLVAISDLATDMASLNFGENSMFLSREADVNEFIRKLNRRYSEIEQVLEQAEEIGTRISRRPYSDHISEMEETGQASIEVHGFGLFIDGRLIFPAGGSHGHHDGAHGERG
jgi:hypothetical protein